LPPDKNVHSQIVDSEYKEYQLDYPLVPSRGTIYRNQNPETIPYQINPASIVDKFYPASLAEVAYPFVFRDVRGVIVTVNPFQYNAAKNTLRVYKNIKIALIENSTVAINPLISVKK